MDGSAKYCAALSVPNSPALERVAHPLPTAHSAVVKHGLPVAVKVFPFPELSAKKAPGLNSYQ
eukprot:1770338-Rhodomonas_salina.1